KFAVNARGLRWTSADGATAVAADGDFGLAGKPERWALKGQARLQRGDDRATVDLAGHGDRDGMRIDRLVAAMPQGRLDGSGELARSPAVKWQADAALAGLDPGDFAPDWPGATNGKLQSSGEPRPTAGSVKAGEGPLARRDAS